MLLGIYDNQGGGNRHCAGMARRDPLTEYKKEPSTSSGHVERMKAAVIERLFKGR